MSKVTVTVASELAPKIEGWLMRRDISYEVEVVRTRKRPNKLRIIAQFPTDEAGKHAEEVYRRFLEPAIND